MSFDERLKKLKHEEEIIAEEKEKQARETNAKLINYRDQYDVAFSSFEATVRKTILPVLEIVNTSYLGGRGSIELTRHTIKVITIDDRKSEYHLDLSSHSAPNFDDKRFLDQSISIVLSWDYESRGNSGSGGFARGNTLRLVIDKTYLYIMPGKIDNFSNARIMQSDQNWQEKLEDIIFSLLKSGSCGWSTSWERPTL
jgi:hypothetical protein